MYLPADCIKHILKYLSMKDSVNACLGLSNRNDGLQLIRHRKSPLSLFSKLVPDAYQLMYYMCVYNFVLSGSRALDYMYPGSCDSTSDWNFYAYTKAEDESDVFGSLKQAFTRMGVVWDKENPFRHSYGDNRLSIVHGHMTVGRGKGQIVQLCVSHNRNIMDTILSFRYTITQCIVTHYGAVHLYGKMCDSNRYIISQRHIALYDLMCKTHNDERCKRHASIAKLREIVKNSEMENTIMGMIEDMCKDHIADQTNHPIHPCCPEESVAEDIRLRVRNYEPVGRARTYILCNLEVCANIVRHKCVCVHNTWFSQVSKYIDRGYYPTTSKDYLLETNDWTNSTKIGLWRYRNAADKETTLLSFKGYGLPCPDDIVNTHILDLRNAVWIEGLDAETPYYHSVSKVL